MDEQPTTQQNGEVPFEQSSGNTPTPAPTQKNAEGWSWGGFMFEPILIIATKKYVYLLFFLLYLIPLINFIAIIGIKIFFGLKGREIVMQSPAFSNSDEARGFMKGLDHAGFISFIFTVVMFALSFLFLGALFSGLLSGGMEISPDIYGY